MSVSVDRVLLTVLAGMQVATLGLVWSLWQFQTGMALTEARSLAGYAVVAGVAFVAGPIVLAGLRELRAHVGGEA